MQDTYKGQHAAKWRKIPGGTLITVTRGKAPGTEVHDRFQQYRQCSTIPDMIRSGATTGDIEEGLKNGTLQIQIGHKVNTDVPRHLDPIERHLKDFVMENNCRKRTGKPAEKEAEEILKNIDELDGQSDTNSSE